MARSRRSSSRGSMRLTALLTVAVIACQMGTGWLAAAQDILPAEPADATTSSSSSSAPSSTPYDLDAISDLDTLLLRHQQYQAAVMADSSSISTSSNPGAKSKKQFAPAVLVTSNDLVGLGNRLPAMVTGFVLALLTQRLFFLHSTFLEFVDLPFPATWKEHADAVYAGSSQCNIPWKLLVDPALQPCEELYVNATGSHTADVWRYSSIDYDMPLLQVNPVFDRHFQKFFADGAVFHHIMGHLFKPKPLVLDAMQPYLQDAQQCAVGIHIRTRKYGGVRVKQFTSIARMVSQGEAGTVFVASDAQLFSYVRRGLPDRRVWWSTLTSSALESATKTKGNNPATELSAVLDMYLLSKCKHIVLTPASSLGAAAAGIAGVLPVYANFGRHRDPFLNPWFWQSVTTEPCFWKASTMHVSDDELSTLVRNKHPLYLYHNQCHYQSHLRRVPKYLKLHTNDTSYIESLLS